MPHDAARPQPAGSAAGPPVRPQPAGSTAGPPTGDAPQRLVIASRKSRLAMWQAEHVRQSLRSLYPQCRVEILAMTTEGDRVLDRALNEIGGKGLFIKELEVALLEGRADLAVHSLKDVPAELAPQFALSAILEREDPRDAFCSLHYDSPEALTAGAKIGTSSLRRAAQLRHRFPQLHVVPLRGNLNTRLARLDEGRFDAIILAVAGLKRLGFADRIRVILAPELCLPAAGQGALGVETLADRPDLAGWLAPLADGRTEIEVAAERAVSRALGGSCKVPLAAWCITEADGSLRLVARVASEDGSEMAEAIERSAQADLVSAEAIGARAARQLLDRGAGRWLVPHVDRLS